jgi:hypothetical protein
MPGGALRTVFLNDTQELDGAYDQCAWAPEMAALEAEDGEASAALRRRMPARTERYGPSEAELVARGVPADIVKGALLMSGIYDLYPVMLSSRSSYLKITTEEEAAFSPMRHLHRIACPVAIVSADQDSPEFQRQSAVFADALAGMGRRAGRTKLFNSNHFQEVKQLAHADSAASRMLFSLMGF